ncbi:hypothetical protein BD289DRAFT_75509 [Coniella lustricola]|uniref:Uncharacterized protein n=1 Tax=Coniella lustricola TaxID=2025994 RepID=A0A2T2ZZI3_9PEZI|nr:hypothetical protein BD289DRAFT_75509 [Coniella lustricola]
MGFISQRRRKSPVCPEHTWDYVQLDRWSVKKAGITTHLDYLLLHVKMVISAIVYAMDMFTAINLIIFDHWSGDIKPPIPFTITRWLFGGCIILSFLNLTYEFYGAWAIIRRGSIVESLLDNMAFRYLSRYTLDGQGWQRFLLFTDLGDTKRKVEHLALFTYVSFQAWVRLVICSGPRQLVNASTMYSVYTTILQPRADQRESSLTASMHNLQNLFEDDLHQALVFSSMFISLVWWVLQVVRLLTACVLFLCFIWMWTRTGDRGLSDHCNKLVLARLNQMLAESENEEAGVRSCVETDKDVSICTPRLSGEQRLDHSAGLTSKHDTEYDGIITVTRMSTLESPRSTMTVSTSHRRDDFELISLQPSVTTQRTCTSASMSRAPLLSQAAHMGHEDA